MKINRIFAKHLYAIIYPKEYEVVWTPEIREFFEESEPIDEMKRLFELWTNPLYLSNYFKINQSYLESSYWKRMNISRHDLITKTRQSALKFEDCIHASANSLNCIFRPLDDYQTKIVNIDSSKSTCDWLRMYAVKIDDNRYMISGGAIKLTRKMEEHPQTMTELTKLEKVKNFFIENGVIDGDSYDDFLYELKI